MNPEKQRIAIAEAVGWTDVRFEAGEFVDYDSRSVTPWEGIRGIDPDFTKPTDRTFIPDYPNSLNAMHEAEKVLTDEQLADMAETLGVDADDAPADSWRLLLRATAAQRAEAFLKTIFKWEQSK